MIGRRDFNLYSYEGKCYLLALNEQADNYLAGMIEGHVAYYSYELKNAKDIDIIAWLVDRGFIIV